MGILYISHQIFKEVGSTLSALHLSVTLSAHHCFSFQSITMDWIIQGPFSSEYSIAKCSFPAGWSKFQRQLILHSGHNILGKKNFVDTVLQNDLLLDGNAQKQSV